jgi:hypothetical protein
MSCGEAPAAVQGEALRARRAQLICDLTCTLLSQTEKLTLEEALGMMRGARESVMTLFPGQERVFDLLYRPRFLRIVGERFRLSEDEMRTFP